MAHMMQAPVPLASLGLPLAPVAAPSTPSGGPMRTASTALAHKKAAPYQQKPSHHKGQKHLGYLTEWNAGAASKSAVLAEPAYQRSYVCPLDANYQLSVLDALAREQEARVKAAMTALLSKWQTDQSTFSTALNQSCDTMQSDCNNLDLLATSARAAMTKLSSNAPAEATVATAATEERAAAEALAFAADGHHSDKESADGTQGGQSDSD